MPSKSKKNPKFHIPTRYYLIGIAIACFLFILGGLTLNLRGGPLRDVAGYVIVPMQKGINSVGLWFANQGENLRSLHSTIEENALLQAEVDRLSQDLNIMRLDRGELDTLRELYQLDQKLPDYEKTGARVISKDPGNWFAVFIIDKGFEDGIEVDMNVVAGAGLVGLVTDVGPNWARVRSIIDDISNVSGMTQSNMDRCIVSGNLQTMNEYGAIDFSGLAIGNALNAGEQIVTSNISDKYLEGILVGSVRSFQDDTNNLTRSGTLIPTVDFARLQEVLVILEKKNYINPMGPLPEEPVPEEAVEE